MTTRRIGGIMSFIYDKHKNNYLVINTIDNYKFDVLCLRCNHVMYGVNKYNLAKRDCYICRKITEVTKELANLNNRIQRLDPKSNITACGKRDSKYFYYYCNNCSQKFCQKWMGKQKLNCPKCSKYSSKNIFQAYQVLIKKWPYYRILNKYEYKNTSSIMLIECTKCGNITRKSIHNAGACSRCYGNYKRTLEDRKIDVDLKSNHSVFISYLNKGIGKFICVKGHEFTGSVNAFLMGSGNCPICTSSRGEQEIYNYLVNHNVPFKRQARFKTCRIKAELPFDFYVDNRFLIEYDGELHYKDVVGFIDSREEISKRDHVKTKWALNNNIPLLRIPYTELNSINSVLDAYINKVTHDNS